MKDIFAIGSTQAVLLFQGIGIESFIINNEVELKNKIEELAPTAKIIFISESLSPLLDDVVEKYKYQTYPILLFIPLEGKESDIGIEKLKKDVERAIGMAIL